MSHGDPKRVVDAYLTRSRRARRHCSPPRRRGRSKTRAGKGREGQAGAGRARRMHHPADPTSNMFQAIEGRWGSREVEITDVAFLDREGQPAFVFHSGDPMSIRLKVRAAQPTDDFVFGIRLFNADGSAATARTPTSRKWSPSGSPATATSTFAIDSLDLVEGTYKLDVAVHKRDGYPYDYHRLLYTFRVKSRTHDVGIYRPRHRWSFSRYRVASSRRRQGHKWATEDTSTRHDRDARAGGRSRRTPACRRQDDRLHERRVRSAAPRPRPLPAAGARARRRADRRHQLRPIGPREQGAGAADHAGGRARRDRSRRSPASTPSSSSTRRRRTT